jgi:putative hemolysin
VDAMKTIETTNSTTNTLAVIEPAAYPVFKDAIPQREIGEGRYVARFARTTEEIFAALKLRFEVFNLELGEGLQASFLTGRDMDEFDEQCHHLIVVDTENQDRVVGTYRMQTSDMARAAGGFYSNVEFELSKLPPEVLSDSIELGRACVAQDHRNTAVLFLLWRGLAAYLMYNRKRYLFGCCSLTSQDPLDGLRVMRLLERNGQIDQSFNVTTQPGFECVAQDDALVDQEVRLPKLFQIYMRYGARVCSRPALDRQFKTIDFLVLFDVKALDEQSRRLFFADQGGK